MNDIVLSSTTTTANPPSTDKDPIKYEVAKILMIGDYNVGRNAVLRRYTENEFTFSKVSLMADFKIKNIIIDEKTLKLQVWIPTFRNKKNRPHFGIHPNNYRRSDGFLIVCDLSNKESYSINNISLWVGEIKRSTNIINPPIVIILNKSDSSYEDEQMLDELQKYCVQNSITLFDIVSARDDINIKESFDALIKLIINDKTLKDNNNNNNNNNNNKDNIDKNIKKTNKSCMLQ